MLTQRIINYEICYLLSMEKNRASGIWSFWILLLGNMDFPFPWPPSAGSPHRTLHFDLSLALYELTLTHTTAEESLACSCTQHDAVIRRRRVPPLHLQTHSTTRPRRRRCPPLRRPPRSLPAAATQYGGLQLSGPLRSKQGSTRHPIFALESAAAGAIKGTRFGDERLLRAAALAQRQLWTTMLFQRSWD